MNLLDPKLVELANRGYTSGKMNDEQIQNARQMGYLPADKTKPLLDPKLVELANRGYTSGKMNDEQIQNARQMGYLPMEISTTTSNDTTQEPGYFEPGSKSAAAVEGFITGSTAGTGRLIGAAVNSLADSLEGYGNKDGGTSYNNLVDNFKSNLQSAQVSKDISQEAHPAIYGATQLAASVPMALAMPGGTAVKNTLTGAATGLTNSLDQIKPYQSAGDMAKTVAENTVAGAGLGFGLGELAPVITNNILAPIRDKLAGMSVDSAKNAFTKIIDTAQSLEPEQVKNLEKTITDNTTKIADIESKIAGHTPTSGNFFSKESEKLVKKYNTQLDNLHNTISDQKSTLALAKSTPEQVQNLYSAFNQSVNNEVDRGAQALTARATTKGLNDLTSSSVGAINAPNLPTKPVNTIIDAMIPSSKLNVLKNFVTDPIKTTLGAVAGGTAGGAMGGPAGILPGAYAGAEAANLAAPAAKGAVNVTGKVVSKITDKIQNMIFDKNALNVAQTSLSKGAYQYLINNIDSDGKLSESAAKQLIKDKNFRTLIKE